MDIYRLYKPFSPYIPRQCCAVKVKPESHAPYIVVVIYRPPSLTLREFLPLLEQMLFTLRETGMRNIFVTGDFNENQLNDARLPIKECFAEYSFQQIVHKPTTRYGSLLDLMCVRTANYVPSARVLQTYYSDHEAVKLFLSIK